MSKIVNLVATLMSVGAAVAFFATVAAPERAGAQQADPSIPQGMALFKENCARCHGWDGSGAYAGDDIGIQGASLVDSKLSEADMIETVTCGRPGTGMPHHSLQAWTPAHKCYGMVLSDLPKDQETMNPLKRNLNETEIKYVVTYIRAFYEGQPMTKAKCIQINGQSAACNKYQ